MDLTILFTIIGAVVTTIAFIYGFLRNFKIDIQNQFERIDKKMDKFDEKLTDIDRRLCRMEGAFSSKDYRVGGSLLAPVLSHHRTYGTVYGGSCSL